MKIVAILLGILAWLIIDRLLVRGLSKQSGLVYEAKLKRNIFVSLNAAALIAIVLAFMSFS
jgi:hypothetical protein